MQSFKSSTREIKSVFTSPHTHFKSQSLNTKMPPPPPPPLFSQPLKRFDSQENMQVSRPATKYLAKFSSQPQFVTPPPPPPHIGPPPPPHIGPEAYRRGQERYREGQETYRQHLYHSSDNWNREDFVQQRHHEYPRVKTDFDASEARKYEKYSPTTIDSEEEEDLSKNIVERRRGIMSGVLDEDSAHVRTSRKRRAERDLEEVDGENAGLPKELTKKFGPLKCDLCGIEVNSTLQAKMHYSGKQHEKKVKSFLQTWAVDTGESLPKQFITGQVQKQTPESSYCDVCNIVLTSAAHAIQHKLGSRHRKNVRTRTLQTAEEDEEELYPADDPTGRFGIGLGFHPRDNPDVLGLMSEESESDSKRKKLFCDLCQVAATCRDQMIMHLKGARHRKAENARKQKLSVDDSPLHSGSLLATEDQNNEYTQAAALDKDYSIYRTPTGNYYCQPCNLTLNSEAQFVQHCQSKKHTKKIQQ